MDAPAGVSAVVLGARSRPAVMPMEPPRASAGEVPVLQDIAVPARDFDDDGRDDAGDVDPNDAPR